MTGRASPRRAAGNCLHVRPLGSAPVRTATVPASIAASRNHDRSVSTTSDPAGPDGYPAGTLPRRLRAADDCDGWGTAPARIPGRPCPRRRAAHRDGRSVAGARVAHRRAVARLCAGLDRPRTRRALPIVASRCCLQPPDRCLASARRQSVVAAFSSVSPDGTSLVQHAAELGRTLPSERKARLRALVLSIRAWGTSRGRDDRALTASAR